MERILARALKPSLRRELLVKQTSNVTCDDFFSEAEISGAPNEDFPVEELFDFSNGNFADEFVAEEDDSVSSHENYINSNCGTLSGIGDFASLSTTELTFPADDLENLEWLSQFVDDSGPELSILYPAGEEKSGIRFQPVQSPVSPRPPFFLTSFPAKTRSKRSRLVGRVWSLDPQALSESSSSPPSSSSTVSSLSSRPVTPARIVAMFDEKPSAKKQKKNSPAPFQRRCSHCQVQKTPQWRTGPLGPKTLCNACGVRYKSGRLFPEYRPACSPTFRDEFHSNSHRKVLEMRRQKDESDSKMSWLG